MDSRSGVPLKLAAHSSFANNLGNRLYFAVNDNPKDAKLQIKNVQLADGGVYRCRVDFFNAATRNLRINLTLIGKCMAGLFDILIIFDFVFFF